MRKLLVLWCLLCAPVTWACTLSDMQRFFAASQALDAGLAAQGESLIRCPRFRDRAVQWLAFYYSMQGQADAARKVAQIAAPPESGKFSKTYLEIIRQARTDDYKPLQQKIRDATLGYVNVPSAQLTLARATARAGEWEASRSAYRNYLRMVNEDLWVEAEYLYTFIWQRDWENADRQFMEARRSAPEEPLKGAVDRGLALLAAKRTTGEAPAPAASSAAIDTQQLPWLRQEVGVEDVDRGFRRVSAQMLYHKKFDAELGLHQLQLYIYDRAKSQAAHVAFAKDWVAADWLTLSGKMGYFSAGEDHFFGKVQGQVRLPLELTATGFVNRDPLALQLPLITDELDLMRLQVGGSLDWADTVTVSSSIVRDGDYAAFEWHQAEFRTYLAGSPQSNQWLKLYVPASLTIHPKDNPNFLAPPRLTQVGIGLQWEQLFARRFSVLVDSGYLYEHWLQRGNLGESERLNRVHLRMESRQWLGETWYWYARLGGSRASTEHGATLYESRTHFWLGMALQQ